MWRFGGLGWKEIMRKVWRQFWENRVLDQSAMLSFYFLLSLFPFLLFLVALLGLVLQSNEVVHQAIQDYLARIAPVSASSLINKTLQEISSGSHGGTLSISLLFSLWVGSNGMVAIIRALNVAYEVEESRPWWKQRLVAVALTISLVLFIGAALMLVGAGGRLVKWAAQNVGLGSSSSSLAWRFAEWFLLLGLLLFAFNLLYVFAPNVKHHRWHWLMPGTVLGVFMWLLASYGFRLYLRFFDSYNVTYGSIATVVILLLWFYLSGIAILTGGELNSELEKRTGKVRSTRRGENSRNPMPGRTI